MTKKINLIPGLFLILRAIAQARIYTCAVSISLLTWANSAGGGGRGPDLPPGKLQVVIGFFRNTGVDPPREAIGPNCFSRVVRSYGSF